MKGIFMSMKKHYKYLTSSAAFFLCAATLCGTSSFPALTAVQAEESLNYSAVQVEEEKKAEIIFHDMPQSEDFSEASPAIFSDYTENERTITEGDIYVSPRGDDDGDGSKENPFATLNRARDAVREMKKNGLPDGGVVVAIMGGKYTDTLSLTSADSGEDGKPIRYAAYGDGEPIFTGSISLDAEKFVSVTGPERSVLSPAAQDAVRVIDLKRYGVKAAELNYNPIGVTNGGPSNVEFYADRENYTLARYPNGNDFLYPHSVTENVSRGALFKVDEKLTNRMKSWSSDDDVYVLGMFNLEYQDTAIKAKVDVDAGTIRLPNMQVYSSNVSSDLRFFIFNKLDELDEPGEWYLDRRNCLLYVYPKEDFLSSSPEFVSTYRQTFVSMENCSFVEIDGLTFSCSRGSGISARSVSDCVFYDCTFYGLGGSAFEGHGDRNVIQSCDISYVGHSGISISGGDKETMTGGRNVVDNNYVTQWGLNSRVFTHAISASGQSNRISHNEIGFSTSNALGSSGNNNIIEYNLVHDCTNYADDCGSFYNGSSWTSGGNVIRYNCFYNIGSDEVYPSAIYWDDGMAYQTAYSNLFVNVSGYAFSIGGGFGHHVIGNVVVNTVRMPVLYDRRPINGFMAGDSFYQVGYGFIWELYKSTPYTTDVWREHFPLLSQVLQNKRDTVAPHFGYNGAFSLFSDNVFVNKNGSGGGFTNHRVRYSAESDNYVGKLTELEDIFINPSEGDYRVREDSPVRDICKEFKDIPYELIGRY